MSYLKKYYFVSCLLILGACETSPPEAYSNRGDPENMLSVSSEMVNIDLTSQDSLNKLSAELAHNPPTRAILNCSPNDKLCQDAKAMLHKFKIEADESGSGGNVALIYERVLARDCEHRYTDNSINENNLNYSAFGCSVRSNTVQMVTDKKQFTNPNLLDFRDGEKVERNYQEYVNPPASTKSSGSGLSGSLINSGASR